MNISDDNSILNLNLSILISILQYSVWLGCKYFVHETNMSKMTISTQHTTLHYNPITFPSPESISPKRWIDTNTGTLDMKEAYQPWSKGSRMCMGIYLATMEAKLILTAL